MDLAADPPTRDRGAVALAAGSVVAGLLAYVYIGLGTREFGADALSGVVQLWTIWFFGSAVLTFPIQHWVIQRLRVDGHGGAVRSALPRLVLITLGLGLAVAVVAFPARDTLFGGTSLIYPLAAGGITVGAALMGLLRGGLAGRGRFVATGMALGTENLVRLTFGVIVIVVGASVDFYAAAIMTGALVILAWPRAVRFEGPAVAGVSAFAFLGNVAGGTVIAQSVLTGGPLVLSLVGGERSEVTSLFAALALFRAPYIVALGLAIRVTAHLTDLMTSGRADEVDRVRRRMVVGGAGLAVLGGSGAAVLGPPILRLVFGSDIDLTRLECALLAGGSLLALSTLGLTLVQMVRTTGERVLRAWLLALAVGVVAIVALPLDPLPLVVGAFLASEVTAFAAMAVGYRPRP